MCDGAAKSHRQGDLADSTESSPAGSRRVGCVGDGGSGTKLLTRSSEGRHYRLACSAENFVVSSG